MTRPAAVHALLEAARKGLDRVHPADLPSEIGAGALVIDTRPVEQRQRDGELPGALIIDRNVLEWRLDPTSPNHINQVTDPGRRIIVVCNEGYSSSLAAATLRQLGLPRATDLIGGFQPGDDSRTPITVRLMPVEEGWGWLVAPSREPASRGECHPATRRTRGGRGESHPATRRIRTRTR